MKSSRLKVTQTISTLKKADAGVKKP